MGFASHAARLSAFFAAAVSLPPSAVSQEPPLETVTVAYHDVATEHVFDAVIEAVQQATVAAQTSGRVVDVYFDVDDYVPKESVLLRIEDTEHATRVAQAQAGLREAQARQKEAQDQYQRMQDLFSKQTVSRADLDTARANLDAARARVAAAEASLEQAEQQLAYTIVKAPYSGIVVERHVEAGEAVSPGQPLMTGFSLERLRAVTSVPQDLIDRVRSQAQARVLAGPREDRVIYADRLTFTPYADQATHTFKVRVDLPEGELGIYPGMFVKVAFVTGREQRLMVPLAAVAHRSEVRGVYVVREGGGLSFRQVRLGRTRDAEVEVLAGLESGERIALDPVAAAIQLKRREAGDRS